MRDTKGQVRCQRCYLPALGEPRVPTELLDDGVFREEIWELPMGPRDVSFFELEGETVWGATARTLRQLLMLLTLTGG